MLNASASGELPVVKPPRSIRANEPKSSGERKHVKGDELTDRQSKALDIVRQHVRCRGVPPSRTELAREMDLAHPSAVDGHLNALAKKGWIELIPSVERGIRLLREGAPILDARHLPTVTAGTPTVVEESRDLPRLNDFDSISQQFEAKPDFFVRVEGDSLDKVGFSTGDIVAVRHQPEARNGDIVLARIGDEVTLKRYERTGPDTVELQPTSTNPEHKPIHVDARTEDVAIVGVVVGAIIGTRRTA